MPTELTASSLATAIVHAAAAIEAQVIAWRRDLHEHPELGNREFRTAGLVAAHLRALGLDEVREKVAHTGVVGLLKGALPGPVVALRADMDGLPVQEQVDLPFASKARATWNGEEVGVMHACGHDCHVAILMGVASVLAGLRGQLHGSVKFIFQPAEEMPPDGEEGGAKMMIAEGALEKPVPKAIFGLHVWPSALGSLSTRAGGFMAAADGLTIKVKGRQTHGSSPWRGVDPIPVAAQVILGLQTVASRQIDVTSAPAVITIGMIQGGNRGNIIPESAQMLGTIRTLSEASRTKVHEAVIRMAKGTAEASGLTADAQVTRGYPVLSNDAALVGRTLGFLQQASDHLIGGIAGVEFVAKDENAHAHLGVLLVVKEAHRVVDAGNGITHRILIVTTQDALDLRAGVGRVGEPSTGA